MCKPSGHFQGSHQTIPGHGTGLRVNDHGLRLEALEASGGGKPAKSSPRWWRKKIWNAMGDHGIYIYIIYIYI